MTDLKSDFAIEANAIEQGLNAVQRLKDTPRNSTDAEIRKAAQAFEGVLLGELMKVMRKTVPQGLFSKSFRNDVFTRMLDEYLTSEAATGGGVGLAEMIARDLGATVPGAPKSGAEGPLPAATAPQVTDPAAVFGVAGSVSQYAQVLRGQDDE